MSITTLAERILLMTPENGFDCGCGNKNGDCTWCRLTGEAQHAGMRRDETPPEFARRFLGIPEGVPYRPGHASRDVARALGQRLLGDK